MTHLETGPRSDSLLSHSAHQWVHESFSCDWDSFLCRSVFVSVNQSAMTEIHSSITQHDSVWISESFRYDWELLLCESVCESLNHSVITNGSVCESANHSAMSEIHSSVALKVSVCYILRVCTACKLAIFYSKILMFVNVKLLLQSDTTQSKVCLCGVCVRLSWSSLMVSEQSALWTSLFQCG